MYEAGTAKTDITAYRHGVGMMGYGMHFNTVDGIETPLHARAYFIREIETGKKIVFVNAEICFITISIKDGVMKKLQRHYPELGLSAENVMLTAQHTHSGPGGYSHYGFYNLTIPGFVPQVYQAIVEGIVKAIVLASKNLQPAKLKITSGNFSPNPELAINRSIKAWNRNPEVPKLRKKDAHHAVDTEMILLSIESPEGVPIGTVNWFGVHSTSVPNDNHKICFDNKGYAAEMLENEIRKSSGRPNFIASFAQAFTGDISPNYQYDWKLGRMRGKFKDGFENAKYNGKLQYEKAHELLESTKKGETIGEGIDCILKWSNFAHIVPDVKFTGGKSVRTVPACHGVAFFQGTAESKGISLPMALFAKLVAVIIQVFEFIKSIFVAKHLRTKIREKYKYQGKKYIMVETGARRVMGTRDVKNLFLPGFVDKSIATFKMHHRNGALDKKPWIPQILPLQIITLGQIAIVGVPGEISTTAGRRLRESIKAELAPKGITKVIISTYANAYCGYITTAEEYDVQCYEGGHTVFGKWTCAAFQTEFRDLSHDLAAGLKYREAEKLLEPVRFSEEELERRSFESPA